MFYQILDYLQFILIQPDHSAPCAFVNFNQVLEIDQLLKANAPTQQWVIDAHVYGNERSIYNIHDKAYLAEHDHLPAPLVTDDVSLDTWGQDVTFEWHAVPNAAEYMLKLGRWPWRTPVSPDPANCTVPEGLFCDHEPSEIIHRGFVAGTSISLEAATGRYCWNVWPRLEDPNSPGTVADGQPYVNIGPFFCYTSGPAEPIIEVDWPSTTGFSSDPIQGTITLPYVPDDQWELIVTPDDDFSIGDFESGCEMGPLYFYDLSNCVLPFTIFPEEGQTYEIEVKTYNSPEVDPVTYRPILDEAYLIHEVTESFTLGVCGVEGEPCCEEEPYCEKTYCTDGICPACGDVVVPRFAVAPSGKLGGSIANRGTTPSARSSATSF